MARSRPLHAIVLAGGEGKRMRSAVPKVLLDLLGQPVVAHVVDAVATLEPRRIIVVGGRHLPDIRRALGEKQVEFVRQPKPQGTGHAVKCGLKALPAGGEGEVLILSGDVPLIRPDSLRACLAHHRRVRSEVTVISAQVAAPAGLGRIVRDSGGRFLRIVEEKDATEEERALREINAGQYVVGLSALRRLLPRLRRGNVQSEYYLTDLVGLATRVAAHSLEDAGEARGLNDPKELEEVRALFRTRILDQLQEDGVQVVAPDLTYVESGVCVAAGSVLHPFTVIRRGVSIAAPCSVGPFAHLRPGTARGDSGGPGDFVDGAAFRAGTVVVPPSPT